MTGRQKKPTAPAKSPSRPKAARRSRTVYARSTSGQLVMNVPPPPRKLPKSTRVFQTLFFIPLLMIEFWFVWAFALQILANCEYLASSTAPIWCAPNGKVYIALLLVQAIALMFLGGFAARLAYRQGIRWRFLVIYTVTLLVAQYMLARLLARIFF